MEMTNEQQRVFDAAMQGKSFFLTGNAGTGKSYVLKKIIEAFDDADENVYVTAPTGIAAVNVHGVTVHSLLGIMPSTNLLSGLDRGHQIKARSLFDEDHHILIMDEVSMCGVDLFVYMMKMIEYAELQNGFDMQIILVGDFSQLPPVYKQEDVSLIEDKFGGLFAFNSLYWNEKRFQTFVLSKIIRQDNPAFTKALNQVRIGDPRGIDYINENSAKQAQTDAITLTGTNKIAGRINSSHLSELPGTTFRFHGDRSAKFSESAMPTDDVLALKLGARVMIMSNTVDAFNGEMGTVEKIVINHQSFEHEENLTNREKLLAYQTVKQKAQKALTKSNDQTIVPKLQLVSQLLAMAYNRQLAQDDSDDVIDVDSSEEVEVGVRSDEDGTLKVLSWHEWKTYRYQKHGRRIKKESTGSFIQLPLRLGYAITIHKSQGQTFSRCNLSPKIFAEGQLYVALSRVTDVHHLYLTYPLDKKMVMASKAVTKYYTYLLDQKGIGSLGVQRAKEPVKNLTIKNSRVKLVKWLNGLDNEQFNLAQSILRNALKLQK